MVPRIPSVEPCTPVLNNVVFVLVLLLSSKIYGKSNGVSLLRVFDTAGYGRIPQDTAGYGKILQDTVGYGRIRQDTAGYGRIRQNTAGYAYYRNAVVLGKPQ